MRAAMTFAHPDSVQLSVDMSLTLKRKRHPILPSQDGSIGYRFRWKQLGIDAVHEE